jgi:hypothetical protein
MAKDVQENADRNLRISIAQLEEMRWAIEGVEALGVPCLPQFDAGLVQLKDALKAIQASRAEAAGQ